MSFTVAKLGKQAITHTPGWILLAELLWRLVRDWPSLTPAQILLRLLWIAGTIVSGVIRMRMCDVPIYNSLITIANTLFLFKESLPHVLLSVGIFLVVALDFLGLCSEEIDNEENPLLPE